MRRLFWVGLSALLTIAIASGGLYARAETFPEVIDLPNGWLPEGIVTGRGPVIYSGSRANGAIYAADLRTGEGSILVPGTPGRIAVGLSYDRRTDYIFAAGGANGNAFVYDADTGATVASYQFASAPTFINDVIVTRDAAYFTDSRQAVLFKVSLDEKNGQPSDTFEAIPLTGDFQLVAGNNANGIEATRNGKELIIVNSALGVLYRVNPTSGVATLIDLGGASVSNGDGLLLQGKTLYVVRNRLNEIAVIKLNSDLERGEVVDVITSANFDVPTTIAAFGDRLYVVNARFTTPPTPETTYTIVQVPR